MLRSRIVWAALVTGAVLRLVLGLRRPLQVDEGYSLHNAGLDLGTALHNLVQSDVHPPLFLLMTHALYAIGLRDIGFRLLTVLFGVVAIWLLYRIVRCWHNEKAAALAALCVAIMPSLIFYDTMIRMYALFDMLALGTFAALSFLYTVPNLSTAQRRACWFAWVLLTALMWYTQYLGFIVTGAQLLFAIVMRRDALFRSLAGGAVAFAAFLPWLHNFQIQLPAGGLAFPFYAQHQLAALGELVGQATIAVQTHGGGPLVVVASIVAWLWLITDFSIAFSVRRDTLVLWLGMPAVLTLLYGWIGHKLLYTDRYYLLLAYALCAWAGVAAWATLQSRMARFGEWVLAGGGVVLATLALVYTLDANFYTADWPAVASTINASAQPNDLIVLEQGSPFFILQRGDLVLQRGQIVRVRPWLPLFYRSSVPDGIKLSRRFDRVWLVLFQSGPIDPDNLLLRAFERRYPHGRVWYFPRALPAENAALVFFRR